MRRHSFSARLLITIASLMAPAAATAAGPYKFYPVNPCRFVDTRRSPGTPLAAGTAYNYAVIGRCGVPPKATAVFLNVVAVAATDQGFVTVYPYPGPFPGISIVNVDAGERAIANGAIIPLGSDNALQLTAVYGTCCGPPAHAGLVLEVMGYFSSE